MGLISIPLSSPPAGLVSAAPEEADLHSPAGGLRLLEEPKSSLETAQPTTEAQSVSVSLGHTSYTSFPGCSLDFPGKGPAWMKSWQLSQYYMIMGKGRKCLCNGKDCKNHREIQCCSRQSEVSKDKIHGVEEIRAHCQRTKGISGESFTK